MQKSRQLTTILLASMLLAVTGCKTAQKARTDQQMEGDIRSKLAAENTLQGKNIGIAVAGGVATLNGSVDNDDMRALAGTDAGSVAGVKTVVNDLTSASAQAAACAPRPVRAHLHARKRYAKKPAEMISDEQAPPPPPDVAPLPPVMARPAPVAVIAPPPPMLIPRPWIYAYAYAPGICCRPVPWVRPIVPVRRPVRVYVRPY